MLGEGYCVVKLIVVARLLEKDSTVLVCYGSPGENENAVGFLEAIGKL